MIVFLDTGIIGLLSSPRKVGEAEQCKEWLYRLLAKSVYVVSSDLCDYEVRRSLLLNLIKNPSTARAIENLDRLQEIIEFLPLTKSVMIKAAELWAEAQSQGLPTADVKTIDADIIISAQSQLLQEEYPGQYIIIATTNVKHLKRFSEAKIWQEIDF